MRIAFEFDGKSDRAKTERKEVHSKRIIAYVGRRGPHNRTWMDPAARKLVTKEIQENAENCNYCVVARYR